MSKSPSPFPQQQTGSPRRCQYCGTEAPLVWVHGHGQCAACGINVQECCQGENNRAENYQLE